MHNIPHVPSSLSLSTWPQPQAVLLSGLIRVRLRSKVSRASLNFVLIAGHVFTNNRMEESEAGVYTPQASLLVIESSLHSFTENRVPISQASLNSSSQSP